MRLSPPSCVRLLPAAALLPTFLDSRLQPVIVDRATREDVPELARLLWLDTHNVEPDQAELDAFAAELEGWFDRHETTHAGFVGRTARGDVVGMAWVAVIPRVLRPVDRTRSTGDLQTLFVLPEHRGQGLGSALVEAAATHATDLGAARVTVHSGRRAVEVYRRLGFAASPRLMQRPPDEAIAPSA